MFLQEERTPNYFAEKLDGFRSNEYHDIMKYCMCEVHNGKLYDSKRDCRKMGNHRAASSNPLQNKSHSRRNASKSDLVDTIKCSETNKTIVLFAERWRFEWTMLIQYCLIASLLETPLSK